MRRITFLNRLPEGVTLDLSNFRPPLKFFKINGDLACQGPTPTSRPSFKNMPRHQEATAKNPLKFAQKGLDKEEKRINVQII